MNTTTTTQGTRCGNHGRERVYHASSADVRACYRGSRPITPVVVSAPPAPTSQAPRNADEARSASMQRLANQTSPFFQDRNMGRGRAVPARPAASSKPEYPASERQVALITSLVEEHLTRPEDQGLAEGIVATLAQGMSSATAKATINALLAVKEQRRNEPVKATDRKAAPASKGWGALVAQVMGEREERNFCIIDEDGKARFYRVSKRGKRSRRPGTWKIQERVTDMLLPRSDSLLGKVCQAIIDQGGAEAAGKRFAELMHRCYECGASLTDTTGNPYYAMGLGPECGAK